MRSLARTVTGVGGLLLCLWFPVSLMAAQAEDTELPVLDSRGLVYVSLGPSFVTNYDGGGRLKYLKADVTLRVRPSVIGALERHLPYIRNRLVVLFSQQLEENLTSTQGKEILRNQALREVRGALDLLDSPDASGNVVDLYFTSFVLQR